MLSAAGAAIAAPASAAAPIAELRGVPDDPVFDIVRSVVPIESEPARSLLEARRRAERAALRVRAALRSEGWYGALVTSDARGGESPMGVVEVELNQRFVFGTINVVFDGEAPGEAAISSARTAIGLAPGAPARAEDVLAAEGRLLAALDAAGYPDTASAPREVVVDHAAAEMSVTFHVESGRAAILGPVTGSADSRIRPGFLEHLAPYEPGAPYRPEVVDTLAARLIATGAFSSANVRLADSRPGEGAEPRPVLVTLREGPRRTITIGVSYSTSEGAGAVSTWSKRNLFQGGENLRVTAKAQTIERLLDAELRVPHFRRPDRTLRTGTGIEQQDTDAFERAAFGVRASVEQPFFTNALVSLGVEATVSEVTETDGETESFALLAGNGGVSWDSSDDPLDPTRGVRASVTAKPVVGAGDQPLGYVISSASASVYYPVWSDRLVAAARGRVGAVFGASLGDLPADQRFFAGGGGSVRGYEYQSLSPETVDGVPSGGRSLVETSLEMRYRVREKFGVVAFVDGGVAGATEAPDTGSMRWAAGVGARYYAGFGPLRADIAFPLDADDGDPGFQIYLSIGQAF